MCIYVYLYIVFVVCQREDDAADVFLFKITLCSIRSRGKLWNILL